MEEVSSCWIISMPEQWMLICDKCNKWCMVYYNHDIKNCNSRCINRGTNDAPICRECFLRDYDEHARKGNDITGDMMVTVSRKLKGPRNAKKAYQ